jgi:hypothetical protein
VTAITSDTLFGRSFRVTLQDKEFGSLDVVRPLTFSFSVQRDKTITPNNVNMLFTNLSADTRQHLEQLSGGFGQGTGAATKNKLTSNSLVKKPTAHKTTKRGVAQADQAFGVTVRLEAGYGEHIGQIFFGVLRKVSSWRQGETWLTQISGGDAEHSISTARISKTFVKGTPLASVLRELVGTLPGVGEGGLSNTLQALQAGGFLAGGSTLQKALTFHGDSATALTQFLRSCGMTWSIQDGAFYAGPDGVATVPGQGPLLTPDTGLVDEPQIDKNGFVVGKALLNPDLIPGRVFRIECSRVTGNFLAEKTQHRGDSTGEPWFVEFVGRPPAKGSAAAAAAGAP